MPWTYETEELSDGMCTTVYDEHDRAIATWLTEERAALIAAAPAMRDIVVKLISAADKSASTLEFSEMCDEFINDAREALNLAQPG